MAAAVVAAVTAGTVVVASIIAGAKTGGGSDVKYLGTNFALLPSWLVTLGVMMAESGGCISPPLAASGSRISRNIFAKSSSAAVEEDLTIQKKYYNSLHSKLYSVTSAASNRSLVAVSNLSRNII